MKFSCLSVLLALSALQECVHGLINPIIPGWNPDPTILRVGEDFFIATSTFETWPGNPIYHSRNLVDWELIGHALNRPSQLALFGTPFNGGVWAPTLRYHDGVFYLTTTTRYVYTAELKLFPRSFYVTTTDIFSNSWSDPIYVDSLGYDPDLFWDTNGDVYYTWAGINNALQSGPKVPISRNGRLRISGLGGTGITHRATIQRGPSPSGPWENNPKNPILYNGADLSLPVQNTGHSDLVELEDGTWFGTALAVRPQAGSQLGRETYLFPVTWEDRWPVFNGGEPLTEHLAGVLEDVDPVKTYDSDFSEVSKLDASFIYLRTPYKKFHTLADRPGYLRIMGNAYAPGDRDSPAMLLRKQTSYEQTFETQLEFSPTLNLTEAGITIYVNEARHNDIAITSDGGKRYIVTRTLTPAKQVGPWALTPANDTVATVVYTELETADEPVRLTIIGNSTKYTLGYAEGDSDFEYTASGPTFIGASFGVYNTGHGRPTLVPADFKYWKQR
ncbi:hypothetical protein BDZ89DRAFT_1045061 [Hymenopellis radicata]|nr:hypothetical protein BDZ89DRAFT_1045061 [Hymenopellis radicata]